MEQLSPSPIADYLLPSKYIDFDHPLVVQKAVEIAANCSDEEELARRCFEFVRDEIRHSLDYQMNPVTCRASEVLSHRTGYCYAKSHLLAALLRANSIPAGLCYQRLLLSGNGSPYCLHGLNAVFLNKYGWYRVDPRGNKPGVDAQFCPPVERLAFPSSSEEEFDLPQIWVEPLDVVVRALTENQTYEDVARKFPDVEEAERNCRSS